MRIAGQIDAVELQSVSFDSPPVNPISLDRAISPRQAYEMAHKHIDGETLDRYIPSHLSR